MRSGLPTLLAVASLHTWTALALRVLDHRLFGATRTIKLKPCQNRATGQEGTCMFAWDCFSAGGTHLTYCTDSFYTGSCCKLPAGVVVQPHDPPSEPTNSIDSMPYGGDDDYKKKTKRPPPSTTKSAVQSTTPTPQATDAVTSPSHKPLPTTSESTTFIGLSTFTPGLITWRPHETTVSLSPNEPSTTVPNIDYPSTGATKTTTSYPDTTTPTRKPTRPAITTTRIPVVASTFLAADVTEESASGTTTENETGSPTDRPTETTSERTTGESTTTKHVDSKPTEASGSSTLTDADGASTTGSTTQRPPSSVPSHTWIVNEQDTTMAIPQSVPTEHTWLVVDEADHGGQQTTTPTPSELTSQTPSTLPTTDWATVTEMVTSISWVDMTELSTQKEQVETPSSSPLPLSTTPQKTLEGNGSTSPTTTVGTTIGAETDTTRPGTEESLQPLVITTEGLTSTDYASTTLQQTTSTRPQTTVVQLQTTGAQQTTDSQKQTTGVQEQATSTQQQTASTTLGTSELGASTLELPAATTSQQKTVPTTLAPQTRPMTTTVRTTTVPTTTTARTTWKYTTVPSYTVSEDSTTRTQEPTTRKPATLPTTTATTPPKATTTTAVPTTTRIPVPTLSADRDIRKICGRPRVVPRARIVGGEQTKFAQWPWMISLRQFKRNTFLHKCGAALVNEYWAISAAHCVHNVSPNDILLRLGEYDLKSDREELPHLERRVQIVATHPRFDASTFEYDLALLRLYEAVPFQDNVMPVCVPDTNDSFVGRTAVVTGWGRLYEDGPLPSVMQKVSVPIITNKECESMYRKAGFIEDIPNIFICAGLAKGGKDSCEGDSGGPLVLKDPKTGQWSLIGIISWGIGCALPNQPGVYTRITHFADWIRQIIVF
ncbi:serine protease notopleural [Haemaphysalis longicornis]